MSGKRKNSIVLRNAEEQDLASYFFADDHESKIALALFNNKFNVELQDAGNQTKIKVTGMDAGEIHRAKEAFSKLAVRFAKGEAMNAETMDADVYVMGVREQFDGNRQDVVDRGHATRKKRVERKAETKDARNHPEKHVEIIAVDPRNQNQSEFLDDIARNDVTFGVGPAGTGKTFLAAYEAVKAFKEGRVEKIFLARPAVGNGKDLGALPGDERAKLAPYLRPLYDELENLIGKDMMNTLQDKGFIEIAPVEFMRGRTFKNAFVILDEAQNTSYEQMKMALTRLGEGSKMVVTGDPRQVDLPKSVPSGLGIVLDKLRNVDGVGIREFTAVDIVRSKVVSKIVMALENDDEPGVSAEIKRQTEKAAGNDNTTDSGQNNHQRRPANRGPNP